MSTKNTSISKRPLSPSSSRLSGSPHPTVLHTPKSTTVPAVGVSADSSDLDAGSIAPTQLLAEVTTALTLAVSTLSRKLQALQKQNVSEADANKWQLWGDNLLALPNKDQFKSRMGVTTVQLDDWSTVDEIGNPKKIDISVEENKSLVENAEIMYQKSRKIQNAIRKVRPNSLFVGNTFIHSIC
jgi:hypothetical protein